MLRGRGVGIWGDVSPKGSEAKETWGDKGREGTQKNWNFGEMSFMDGPILIGTSCGFKPYL